MNVIIVDYNSGNISSVINSFKEVAKDKVNIEVTSDLNKIKSSDKVVLPGPNTTAVACRGGCARAIASRTCSAHACVCLGVGKLCLELVKKSAPFS